MFIPVNDVVQIQPYIIIYRYIQCAFAIRRLVVTRDKGATSFLPLAKHRGRYRRKIDRVYDVIRIILVSIILLLIYYYALFIRFIYTIINRRMEVTPRVTL